MLNKRWRLIVEPGETDDTVIVKEVTNHLTIDEKHIWSNLAIHPGESLAEEIEFRGISQKDLAAQMGRPAQAVNEIIRGKKSITSDTAFELEYVLGIPAQFWINLQVLYDATLARNARREILERQVPLLKAFHVSELERRGGIPRVKEKTDKVPLET